MNPDSTPEIALAFDDIAFRGASFTIQSALAFRQKSTTFRFHLFTKNLTPNQIQHLDSLSNPEFGIHVVQRPIDDNLFTQCKSLHGNFMTYARILLPDLVSTHRLLYLDSDLVVTDDLSALWQSDLKNRPLGAVSKATVEWSNDRAFLNGEGIKSGAPYFNAGVLLIDCEKWRHQKTGEKLIELANLHGPKLPSVDQTLLNLAFHDRFMNIDPKWNQNTYAGASESTFAPGIIHFLGQPKPWSLFSGLFHRSHQAFHHFVKSYSLSYPPVSFKEYWRSIPQTLRSSKALLTAMKAPRN